MYKAVSAYQTDEAEEKDNKSEENKTKTKKMKWTSTTQIENLKNGIQVM